MTLNGIFPVPVGFKKSVNKFYKMKDFTYNTGTYDPSKF